MIQVSFMYVLKISARETMEISVKTLQTSQPSTKM